MKDKALETENRIRKLAQKLGLTNETEELFTTSLLSQSGARSVVIRPPWLSLPEIKTTSESLPSTEDRPKKVIPLNDIPWSPPFIREHHSSIKNDNDAEAEYPLDLSSVFMSSPLGYLSQYESIKSFISADACASPGGKSVLLSSFINCSLLLANEKDKNRLKPLISNFSRLEVPNSCITNYDARALFKDYNEAFQCILLDVPCSGQSLFGRGFTNSSSFTPIAADTASGLQKSLIHRISNSVTKGGYILYTTCTFSREENEKVIQWFLKNHSEFKPVTISALESFQSSLAEFPAYRLWPHQGMGSGGFTCLLKKEGELEEITTPKLPQRVCWKNILSDK